MAIATSTTGAIAHIAYPDPCWTDGQRSAWEAVKAIYDAYHTLSDAHYHGVLPSYEPANRAWLAWMEAEREAKLIHWPEGL